MEGVECLTLLPPQSLDVDIVFLDRLTVSDSVTWLNTSTGPARRT